MAIYYSAVFFMFGAILGSFFNVVGERLPEGKSIVKPRSHCPKCKHTLTPIELVPIFSYIIQRGKCKNCKEKIPPIHPIYEFLCGLIFLLSYLSFNFSYELIIVLSLVSMLLIIIVSDYLYMIIPDEVLIFFGIILIIEIFFIYGIVALLYRILSGIIAFMIMFLIKIVGDKIFKRESMGGGDIKLLFFFGLCLGWEMAIFSIFLGSMLGFPVSLIILKVKKDNVLPFGPFLSLAAIIILLLHFDFTKLVELLTL